MTVYTRKNTLKNDFSWSFSRNQTFQECQKKYWYTYYGSWEGWPKTPYDSRESIDPLAQKLYELKNMQQLVAYIGTVVHETIEEFLKKGKIALSVTSSSDLIKTALNQLNTGLTSSKNEKWKAAPKKHLNLFEHYYHEDISESDLKSIAEEKIERSLLNWYNSAIVQKILLDERSTWLSIEELQSFPLALTHPVLSEVKVIVVLDLAIRWQTNTSSSLLIFDWKTGDPTEKNDQQLALYAFFAEQKWQAPFNTIILCPFYVAHNHYKKIGERQEQKLDQNSIESIKHLITSTSVEMLKFFDSIYDPKIGPEHFPYTDNRTKCRTCSFKEICTKAEYKQVNRDELKTLFNMY